MRKLPLAKIIFLADYPSVYDGFGTMTMWKRPPVDLQLAAHLRGELERKRWSGQMPGVIRLARELGAARNTVESALRELEREGLLVAQGYGKRRAIAPAGMGANSPPLRVVVLLNDAGDKTTHYIVELIHALREAGHHADYAPKTQTELGFNVTRAARMIKDTPADAWVVFVGSRELLEWFAASKLPVFALAGRPHQLPIASIAPDKVTPMRLSLRRLVELGHRKIVLLCRPQRLIPVPGRFEQAFLDELESQGIETGPYNLLTWDETAKGLHQAFDSVFRYTPPTALVVQTAPPVTAVLQFCMKRGLKIPEDFSLISTDPDPAFEWCQPSIAHIWWDSRKMIRRIVRWTENMRVGKEDRRKGFIKARFVGGETIGPVPAGLG